MTPSSSRHLIWGPAIALFAGLAAGCPNVNSPPCDTDADCPSGRCRRGACGPVCLDDTECGTEQVCAQGMCEPRPECSADGDCATGFACRSGRCQCTSDAACAANQGCVSGRCEARPRCKSDEECIPTGRRCEVTQGLCVPVCALATDCAPGLDARVATALYSCQLGTCRRRCLNDQTCGQGLICADGLCAAAECTSMSECPAGQYCTSATFGRCLEARFCSSPGECPANHECRLFGSGECPPGYPCNRALCQELPRCLIDSDCAPVGPPLPGQRPAICQDAHCQATTRCSTPTQCGAGRACVAGVCVPGPCRGLSDCPSGNVCVDGRCAALPAPGDINRLELTPAGALLEVGDTVRFTLIAYRLDGSSAPLPGGTFDIVDGNGQASAVASADGAGRVTGVSAGQAKVRASVAGANVGPLEAEVTVYPAVTSGQRRVLVVDAATRRPVQGAAVLGCFPAAGGGSCGSPVTLTTGADGTATFSFGAGAADFSVASAEPRSDGLPRYDRVTFVGVDAADLVVPLTENPVRGAAGFNGSISFADVHSSGTYWIGLAVMSAGDPGMLDLRTLLGETFQVTLPGVNQRTPVPGSFVLYTSIGFGIPNEVKGRSLGLAHPGRRASVAFAGRSDLEQLATARSAELLAYVGAMDYAVLPPQPTATRLLVPDTADVDNDGLCAQPSRCPQGSEDVPDYAGFTPLSFSPRREQNLRTEVVLPNLPRAFDTAVVAAVQRLPSAGALPLGLSSRAGGAPAADGTRPVAPFVLRSGAPYAGVELGEPGLWAIATSLATGGASQEPGGNVSGRLTRSPALPTRVVVAPFLPLAARSAFGPATRSFSPGQPEWSGLASAGADLAQLVLTGTQGRHIVFFPLAGDQTTVRVPTSPAAPGIDPAGQPAVRMEIVAFDLAAGVSPAHALDLQGVNLLDVAAMLDGYSRFQP